MKHLIVSEGSRHYLKKGTKKVRVIPKKYQDLLPGDIVPFLEDHKLLTLTDGERFNLEYLKVLSGLKIEQPFIHERISKARPTELQYVQPSTGDAYYELKLNNGFAIRVGAVMVKYYGENIQTIYRNY